MNAFPALAIIGISLGISTAYAMHGPLDQLPDEPREWAINVEKYSEDAVAQHLAHGRPVFVTVRSELAPWSPEFLGFHPIGRKERVVIPVSKDLIWTWDGKTEEAKPFFEEFGHSKEPFVVNISPDGSRSKIDFNN